MHRHNIRTDTYIHTTPAHIYRHTYIYIDAHITHTYTHAHSYRHTQVRPCTPESRYGADTGRRTDPYETTRPERLPITQQDTPNRKGF